MLKEWETNKYHMYVWFHTNKIGIKFALNDELCSSNIHIEIYIHNSNDEISYLTQNEINDGKNSKAVLQL